MEVRYALGVIQPYADTILSRADVSVRKALKETLFGSLNTMYAPTMQRYVETVIGAKHGHGLSAREVDPLVVAQGIDLIAEAAIHSDAQYKLLRPNIGSNPAFVDAIATLNEKAASGDIWLMPEEFAMTTNEGRLQVSHADEAFTDRDPRVQLFLAGLNYAAFTPKTMLTGTDMLMGAHTNLKYWTEKGEQESMPHLVISNFGIGEIMTEIITLRRGSPIPLTIVDAGSGTGATLAGIVMGLEEGVKCGGNLEGVSLLGIEGTVPLYDQLYGFAEHATNRLNESYRTQLSRRLDPTRPVSEFVAVASEMNPQSVQLGQNEFSVMCADIAGGLEALQFSQEQADGITVVTANYSWHRLPTNVKDGIMKNMKAKCSNLVFIVADLVENGSEVNRRYFNFRDNGLLNCGNTHLDSLFGINGFMSYYFDSETVPEPINSRLAQTISGGVTSDAIFKIAYSGDLARQVLDR